MNEYQYGVSVRLQTYNHEPFIRQAIESVLMQQTTFMVEVVIGDDFSTDGTLAAIREYTSTDNIHIKLLERSAGDNYYMKRKELGRLYNFADTLYHCTGKYVAFLDGDDYWIDRYKLQKQFDFLEANQKYVMCFTDGQIVDENGALKGFFSERFKKRYQIDEFNHSAICKLKSLAATAGYFFRNELGFLPMWFFKIYGGDSAVLFLLSKRGLIRYLPIATIAYRVNAYSIERQYDDNKVKAKRNISEDLIYFHTIENANRKYPAGRLAWNYFYLSYRNLVEFKLGDAINCFFNSAKYKAIQFFYSTSKSIAL